VDESAFDKKLIPIEEADCADKSMVWSNGQTKSRSPGPGPIATSAWKSIAQKWLKDKNVVLHSDNMKAYKLKTPGVVHGSVVHRKKKKKRVKAGGKWAWPATTYVKLKKILPRRRSLKVKVEGGHQGDGQGMEVQ
ncbi:unnamed protein product, partial [Symbiodinium pilosum]